MVTQTQEVLLQGIAVVASIIYLSVAYVLSRRPVDANARAPHRAFILWWGGLGIIGFLGVALTLGPGLGALGLGGARVALYVLVAFLFVMLGGLSYYLLYVYTGSHRSRRIVVLFYLAMTVLFVYLIESQSPTIDAEGEFTYADERPPGDALSLLFSLGLVLPPLAAAAAYLGLYWRVEDRTSKYRILMVSGGIVLWFTYSAVNSVTQGLLGVSESPFGARLAGQLLGVLAALLVLAAYLPPRFIRERFGVRTVLETEPDAAEPPRQARPHVMRLQAAPLDG